MISNSTLQYPNPHIRLLLLVQVAQQQGKYMAKLVKGGLMPGMEVPEGAQVFKYSHKGSLAYVGNDNAVMVMLNPTQPIAQVAVCRDGLHATMRARPILHHICQIGVLAPECDGPLSTGIFHAYSPPRDKDEPSGVVETLSSVCSGECTTSCCLLSYRIFHLDQ